MVDDFEKAAWVAETRRMFEALTVEVKMVADDLKVLQERVMAACVVAVDPEPPIDPPIDPPVDPPPDTFVPPVIAIVAAQATVKEG